MLAESGYSHEQVAEYSTGLLAGTPTLTTAACGILKSSAGPIYISLLVFGNNLQATFILSYILVTISSWGGEGRDGE